MRSTRAVAIVPLVAGFLLLGTPASGRPSAAAADAPAAAVADVPMPVEKTLSTTAVNTSSVAIPVPAGITPAAITAVLTQPEVVAGGSVQFSVNGAPALSVPSALYQKVRIPVTRADVIADGTIGLSMVALAAPVTGQPCVPQDGTASLRKIELGYTGTETPPTTVAGFFGPSAARVDVVIPADASDDMIEAGLTAVDALARRYPDDTPVQLTTTAPPAETATASQRVVALVQGRAGEVATAVSTTGGIPMLTLTGTGAPLVAAAQSLSSDALSIASGQDPQDPSAEMKTRSTETTRSLDGLGVGALTLTGYGSTTQQFEVSQDDFSSPVSSLALHLVGSHTAFAADSGARLDVRANGALVGSTVLGASSALDLDLTIPAGRLAAVNDIAVTLSALSPTGVACTPPAAPAAEVDIDTKDSTLTATRGTGKVEGFQLYPQVFQGTLPICIRATGKQRVQSAIDAADLVAALQRAAAAPFDIQLTTPDAFLADDRSGLIVGALAQDSVNLDAPLRLSSTRRLDRADSTFAVTSQDPYAVLESIDRHDRFVLMLGSWAPGGVAAPAALSRKVADAVVAQGWSSLSGDLVIADAARPAFGAASRSLKPHVATTEEKSYAAWFVGAIAVLLVLLAFQVVVSIRRDRQVARLEHDDSDQQRHPGPAYVEEEDHPATDGLGDVDDLQVAPEGTRPADHADPRPAKPESEATGDTKTGVNESADTDTADMDTEATGTRDTGPGDTDEGASEEPAPDPEPDVPETTEAGGDAEPEVTPDDTGADPAPEPDPKPDSKPDSKPDPNPAEQDVRGRRWPRRR